MRGTSHINCSLRGLRNVVTLKFTSKKGRPPSAFLLSSPLYQSPLLLSCKGCNRRNRTEEKRERKQCAAVAPSSASLSTPPPSPSLPPSPHPTFLPSSKQPRSIDARPRPLRRRPRESPQHPTLRGGRGGGVREAGAVGSSRLVAVASLPARLLASKYRCCISRQLTPPICTQGGAVVQVVDTSIHNLSTLWKRWARRPLVTV